MKQIHDIQIIPKRKILDERGGIFHMLRNDDPEFINFGEIYFSKVFPQVIKAWHIHSKMTLNYYLVNGCVKLVLFDDRKNSPTYKMIQEIIMDECDPKLVIVPPLVWNGFKGLGTSFSLIANCATHPHDPQEISRKPFNDPYFSYDWSQKHG